MSLFRNEKRTEFYNDLQKVSFDKIVVKVKIKENNIDIKNVLKQIKKEAGKISKAIENWRKNKTHTDTTDNQGTYSKSKSQNYLNGLKNACKEIEKININSDNINSDDVQTKIDEIDKILLKPILNLKSALENAATAKFSLFTFGAVLDDRKNKKRLAEISKDIGKLHKNIVNTKEIIEEKAEKKANGKKDPEIFKGLSNEENYCYLNTALQNLYHNSSFRKKVLKFQIENKQDIENIINGNITKDTQNQIKDALDQSVEFDDNGNIKQDFKNYVHLAGNTIFKNPIPQKSKWKGYDIIIFTTQFFFKYLDGQIDDKTFNDNRKKMALLLQYKGNMANSHTIQTRIENACIHAMSTKPRVEKIYNDPAFPNDMQAKSLAKWEKVCPAKDSYIMMSAELIFYELYKEKKICDAILNLQDDDFYLNDSAILEVTHNFFSQWKNNKSIYTKENVELFKNSGLKLNNFNETRKNLMDLLRNIKYSKNSKILSIDSNIIINTNDRKNDLVSCIENALNAKRKQGQNSPKYRLPLKDNKFEATFNDRTGGRRSGFTAEEEIDLAGLVNNNKLTIFSNGKELDKSKTKFKLVSATIGTGGHYYLYVKEGSTWRKLNDNHPIIDVSWENIQQDINTMCETLTYELI